MWKFVLDMVIMVSLAVVVYLMARALPRISDKDLKESELETPWMLIYLERMDEKIKLHTEKFLRKFRIKVMQLDNSLGDKLKDYRKDDSKEKGLGLEMDEDEE